MIIKYLPEEYLEEAPENLSENDQASADFMAKLKETEGIDAKSALKNCATAELLISTIKQYYSTIDEKALELQQYFEAEDWKNYEIKVHALKSTSRLIGATALSKLAEHLEECAGNNKIDEIQNEHKILIDSYLNFKHILKPLTEENPDQADKSEISQADLLDAINQMIVYADAFDLDGLDEVMNKLSSVKLPLDFSQKFSKIQKSIENVDFKELRLLLSEWSNKE